jgi:putative transposase
MQRLPEQATRGEPEPSAAAAAAAAALSLDELAREGARRRLGAALEAGVADSGERHAGARAARGWAEGTRDGHGAPRKVTVGSGTLEGRAPRVEARRVVAGERRRFSSRILPPDLRRSPRVTEGLPLLDLRGLSTGDFREALGALLGEAAAGRSATAIARLLKAWQEADAAFRKRDRRGRDSVCVRADGAHFNSRPGADRRCTLAVIGASRDGTEEVSAVEAGDRESTASWLGVLRGLARRGMGAPLLGIADRALGFRAAARAVWPEMPGEACRVHRLANVPDKLPTRLQPKAKRALHAMLSAPSRAAGREALAAFAAEDGAKYPKAAASLTADRERLLTHFACPAGHWGHPRTTNPIESTFATGKRRQRVTKGAGSRPAGLTMARKLLPMAQPRWRKLNAPHPVARVRMGVRYRDGVAIDSLDRIDHEQTAA